MGFFIQTLRLCRTKELESSHTFAAFLDPIYLKDVLKLNICIPPLPSCNSWSHTVLTPVTFSVSAPVFRTFIRSSRGFLCPLRKHLCEWRLIRTWTHRCAYMQAHTGAWSVDLAQARSLMQPHRTGPDLTLGTAHSKKLTAHVCQDFHHLPPYLTKLCLFSRSYPALKSRSICLFCENVWVAGRVRGGERVFD